MKQWGREASGQRLGMGMGGAAMDVMRVRYDPMQKPSDVHPPPTRTRREGPSGTTVVRILYEGLNQSDASLVSASLVQSAIQTYLGIA